MLAGPVRIRDQSLADVAAACASGRFKLDYGAATVQLHCSLPGFARVLHNVYGAFRILGSDVAFADYHVRLLRGRWLRAIARPQARFLIDGMEPFDPFPLDNALPLFEWGLNWSFGQRGNQYVLLHAGVLARNDQALVMAAPPGSGKSTLAAAMMLRGFRLLSDEFGVLCPETAKLLPMLKPVALKNASVDVIRRFSANALMGPLFRGTKKGDVAHLAPDDRSTDGIRQPARPALVLFPSFESGAQLRVQRMPGEDAFAHLAFNSFNYHLLGPVGFKAIADVIESCPAYKLRYSDLDQAIERIGELLDEAGAKQTAGTA